MALPLIDEILCRLPVKHLLCCRCVSKDWCSLIDSAAFIKKHHANAIECNPEGDGVIINDVEWNPTDGDGEVVPRGQYCLTDLESLYGDENEDVVEIDEPLKTVLWNAGLVGAANCLACFCKNGVKEFVVVNPATRKFRKVPGMVGEIGDWFEAALVTRFGFGYDHVNDDYKIVRVAQFTQDNPNSFHGIVVAVYSLRSDNWTEIQNVPSNVCLVTQLGLFTSGALYWLGNKVSHGLYYRIIVSFDLGIGQYMEIPFPVLPFLVPNECFSVVPTRGSLCIFNKHAESGMDVWLKNNSGEESPWYKAFSVEQCALGSFEYIKLVAFSKDGKEVLLNVGNTDCRSTTKLVWYEPERKVVKNVRICGIPSRFGSKLYRESLLQLTKNEGLVQLAENEGLLQLTVNEQLQKPSEDKKEEKQQKKRDTWFTERWRSWIMR
ncbi:hypothetical protein ACET3Z_004361 [Daucus carota]